MEPVRFESFLSDGMVVGRLLPGTDLIPGLLEACHSHGARFAIVSSLIGSLAGTSFIRIIPDGGSAFGIKYDEPVHVAGGVEIISCQGMIGEWDDGQAARRSTAHLHYSLVDTAGRAYAGHVCDTGNPCLITVEFALRLVSEGSIVRRIDPGIGFPLFNFEARR